MCGARRRFEDGGQFRGPHVDDSPTLAALEARRGGWAAHWPSSLSWEFMNRRPAIFVDQLLTRPRGRRVGGLGHVATV